MTPVGSIAEWFTGKTPADLDVIEHGGRYLYRDTIKRHSHKEKGKLIEVPVLLRVPVSRDKALARLDALQWAAKLVKEAGHKPIERLTIDVVENLIGRVYFDELDTKCLVARCVLEIEPPHEQYFLYEALDSLHEHASIMDLWDRLCYYQQLEDVRLGEVTEEQLAVVVAAIDKVRNISPLVAMAGSVRDSCIVTMASQLASYQKRSLQSRFIETSTPTRS